MLWKCYDFEDALFCFLFIYFIINEGKFFLREKKGVLILRILPIIDDDDC